MEASRQRTQSGTPEQLIHSLIRKLTQHVVWDALLVFLPPLVVVLYCISFLYFKAWLSPMSAVLITLTVLAVCAVAIAFCYWPKVPSGPAAARLIDDRVGAQDRFLTLATLQPSATVAAFRARLHAEAAALQSRIALKRDFPYKIKRPVYTSLLASLIAAIVFHLIWAADYLSLQPQSSYDRLGDLTQQLAARPELQAIARSLKNLTAKLEHPEVSPDEKRELAREERQRMQHQEKSSLQNGARDLSSQPSGALEGIEQQAGSGDLKKDQQQQGGGGDIQTNLPEQGQGEGRQSQGTGGATKGDGMAEANGDMKDGRLAKGSPKEKGEPKSPGESNGDSGQKPDPSRAEDRSNSGQPGKTDGAGADREGRNKVTEEIPRAAPPSERFQKPGEGGYQGIKGAGYVTVQLPEELAAEGKGTQRKSTKGGKSAPSSVPVSNVPLPKHVPDAPAEKQQMPLEYRGIIR
jgi:hypothetical protein